MSGLCCVVDTDIHKLAHLLHVCLLCNSVIGVYTHYVSCTLVTFDWPVSTSLYSGEITLHTLLCQQFWLIDCRRQCSVGAIISYFVWQGWYCVDGKQISVYSCSGSEWGILCRCLLFYPVYSSHWQLHHVIQGINALCTYVNHWSLYVNLSLIPCRSCSLHINYADYRVCIILLCTSNPHIQITTSCRSAVWTGPFSVRGSLTTQLTLCSQLG